MMSITEDEYEEEHVRIQTYLFDEVDESDEVDLPMMEVMTTNQMIYQQKIFNHYDIESKKLSTLLAGKMLFSRQDVA